MESPSPSPSGRGAGCVNGRLRNGLTVQAKGLECFRFGNIPKWKETMTAFDKTADQFLILAQRFIRLRPKLVLPDERMATLKGRLRELRESGKYSHEDQVYLFRIPLL